MGGCHGKLTEAVQADQHDPHPRDQESEFGPEAGAAPEDEPGDRCGRKGNAAQRGQHRQPRPPEAAPSGQHERKTHDSRKDKTDGSHVEGRERAARKLGVRSFKITSPHTSASLLKAAVSDEQLRGQLSLTPV